jgi:hypothetical protein
MAIAQTSRTTTTYTPNVGPHAGTPSIVAMGLTPLAVGMGPGAVGTTGERGYPAAIGLMTAAGVVKLTFAVADLIGEDPFFPGQTTASIDALNDTAGYPNGVLLYDPDATTLATIKVGYFAFLSQLTS